MPSPNGSKTIKEAHILEEIGVEPQSRRNGEHCDCKQNKPENRHHEEQSDQAKHAHTQIPDPESHLHRPKREHDDCKNDSKEPSCIEFCLDLRAFIEPDEVEIFTTLLLLLDLDCP